MVQPGQRKKQKRTGRRSRKLSSDIVCSPTGIWYRNEVRPTRSKTIRDILPTLIARYGVGRKLNSDRMIQAWDEIRESLSRERGDSTIFERIRIRSFRAGTIALDLPNNVIYQEMLFLQETVLHQFQEKLPTEQIKKIRFAVRK